MDTDQHQLYEYASKRVKQKKRLFFHFVLFVLGSLFFYIANNWLDFYPDKKWWLWAITIWGFIFILHFIKVFVTDAFMSKSWERTQIDKLIELQNKKIEKLKTDIDKNSPPTI